MPSYTEMEINVILMKFSSLTALEVVTMTTSSASSDENFVKMTLLPGQYYFTLGYDLQISHWDYRGASYFSCFTGHFKVFQ